MVKAKNPVAHPKLLQWMEENHMSVAALARRARVTPDVLYKLLSGADSRRSTVMGVLRATGLSYDELFGGDEA